MKKGAAAPESPAADRRALIADAAINTLAAVGMRGLTHRAVDRAAGLSEGSTSYYFRTRHALLHATLARINELGGAELAELPVLAPEFSIADATELVVRLLGHWLNAGRDRAVARYELTMESLRRPELRAMLHEHELGFRRLVADRLRAAGLAGPERRAHLLIALFDGLILNQVTGSSDDRLDEAELREMISALLHAGMTG